MLCVAVLATWRYAPAQPATDYTPKVGQEGKDVIWVPTPQALVDRMLDMAKATPKDYVIDLGSGDGRTVITAAKRGIKAHGIEYNPDMVELAKAQRREGRRRRQGHLHEGRHLRERFLAGDRADAVPAPDLNIRLRPTILNMKPGTRVVSNTFTMGDWEPDDRVEAPPTAARRSARPVCGSCRRTSKARGRWGKRIRAGAEVSGDHRQGRLGNVIAPITNGKMIGDRIAFTAGGTQYAGTVTGNTIEGTSKAGGSETKWQATRTRK